MSSRRAFVVGHPVAQSRSPLIHAHWLAEHGLDGTYERIDVAPAAFAAFVQSLDDEGFVGGNVTIPHKGVVAALAARLSPVAQTLGAANTVWFDEDQLCATNTDVEGFLANLDAGAPGWDGGLGRVAVLGAGGAARGIVHALLERGAAEVLVANRTHPRAMDLAARFGETVRPVAWDGVAAALDGTALLVNTTSLGMRGQPSLDLDLSALPTQAVVTDLVYAPLETALLAKARLRGNRTVDGLGMLLHQAVPGFERWFGVRPAVTPALRDLVAADIRSRG